MGCGAHRDGHFNLKFVEELKSPRKVQLRRLRGVPGTLYSILARKGHQAHMERLAQPGCREQRETRAGLGPPETVSHARGPGLVLLFVRNCPGPGGRPWGC